MLLDVQTPDQGRSDRVMCTLAVLIHTATLSFTALKHSELTPLARSANHQDEPELESAVSMHWFCESQDAYTLCDRVQHVLHATVPSKQQIQQENHSASVKVKLRGQVMH